MASLDKKLNNVFKELEIDGESGFKNLDSLDRIELITELEEEFEIDIYDEDFNYIKNIEQLKELIKKKIDERIENNRNHYF